MKARRFCDSFSLLNFPFWIPKQVREMLWNFSLREKMYWCLKNEIKKWLYCNKQWWDYGQTQAVMCNYPSGCPIFFPTFVTLKFFESSHSASSDSSRNHLYRVCLNVRQAEVSKINIWIQHTWHLTVREGLQRYSSGFRTQAQWFEPKFNKYWKLGTVANLPRSRNPYLEELP